MEHTNLLQQGKLNRDLFDFGRDISPAKDPWMGPDLNPRDEFVGHRDRETV